MGISVRDHPFYTSAVTNNPLVHVNWSFFFGKGLFYYYTVVGTYLIDTRIMAKIRYFPKRGTTKDVGGMISTTSRKNTWRLINIEIDRVTC